MANTINTNVIVPEVYAQLVRDKIAGKVKVAQFLVNLGDLHGKVGETLTMPTLVMQRTGLSIHQWK